MKKRELFAKGAALALVCGLTLGLTPAMAAPAGAETVTVSDMAVAGSVCGWVTTAAAKTADNKVTVTIMPAGKAAPETYTTALSYGTSNAMTGTNGADVITGRCAEGTFVEVCLNAAGEVIDLRRVLQPGLFFDTAKFGGDLTNPGSTVAHRGADYTDIYGGGSTGSTGVYTGLAGDMVASGWVLAKADGTLTLGDGNMTTQVFHETYTLAPDAEVYEIDAATFASTEKTVADIPVTPADKDGHIYATPSQDRRQAVVVFDGSYQSYGTAKVRAVYYYAAPLADVSAYVGLIPQNVRVNCDLSEPTQGSPSPSKAVYLSSANPITVVEGKMWTIGDIEDNCPIFKGSTDAEMGKAGGGDWLVQFDTGWPPSGYQYFRNIEKVGLDPRDIDMILIPHGHGDHYGTAYDEWEMIVRAGGSPIVYESYEDTIGFDIHGFPEIGGIYTDAAVRTIITNWYPNDQWISLGNGLQMQVTLTPGHSQGTGSAVFQVTVGAGGMKDAKLSYEQDAGGEWVTTYSDYKEGDEIMFAYMGGYGINGLSKLDAGFRRNAFVSSLRYIESVFSNLKTTTGNEPDGIYNLAQHTNQYPYSETALIMQMYNEKHGTDYSFLHFMREGREEVINFCEKRASAMLYSGYTEEYMAKRAQAGDADPLYDFDGLSLYVPITSTTIQGNTLEDTGPFKHQGGETVIQLDPGVEVLVMHGYDVYLNKGSVPQGEFINLAGENGTGAQNFDVSRGYSNAKDGFVYDPDLWYVQVGAHVQDDYDGRVYSGKGVNTDLAFVSGPVEAVRGEGWSEIIRTEGMIKAQAQALAASLESGGTYTVELKKTGDIVNNTADLMKTFVKTDASTAPAQPSTPAEPSVPAQPGVPEAPAETGARTYTVAKGDCLWDIAYHFYGTGAAYTKILAANADQISDPSLLYVGQVLVIPAN